MGTTQQRGGAAANRWKSKIVDWWNVDDRRRQGERLGIGVSLALAAASALALYRGQEAKLEHLALASAALLAIALVLPDLLYPLAWLAETAFRLSARALMYLLLVLVFYLVFTPLGLMMRLLGRDAMKSKWDAQAQTYWEKRKRREPDHAERQF